MKQWAIATESRRRYALVAFVLCLPTSSVGAQQPATKADTSAVAQFPAELVRFEPHPDNPVFKSGRMGDWDAKIRERGWIRHEDGQYRMWYTGYDGTSEGTKMLGYATSPDGLKWTRYPDNPVYSDHWVEDMMIVKHDGTYYMFAEGRDDQAHLLSSADGVKWSRQGQLDIRTTSGDSIPPGPYGTPTALFRDGTWYLFYERSDAGVWLAKSDDLKVWTNVQDGPVLVPGPAEYDQQMIALNQVIRYEGRYYAYYHGSGSATKPRTWTTNVAVSDDLVHWTKYPHNPLIAGDKSSGILVFDGERFRLYTMHDQVDVYFSKLQP